MLNVQKFVGTSKAIILEAQYLYGLNQFSQLTQKIKTSLGNNEIEPSEIPFAFGLLTAGHIGLGNIEDARNSYVLCRETARHMNNQLVANEIRRIAPKVVSWEIGIEELNQASISEFAQNNILHKARYIHNLGFSKIIKTFGLDGRKDIEESYKIFEETDSPYITYTIVALSVCDLIDGAPDRAINRLLDGLNLSSEQYDRFAISTNLGCAYLLKENLDEAEKYFQRALDAMRGDVPLMDPVLLHKGNYNLALVSAMKGEFSRASVYFSQADVPSIANFNTNRVARNNRLKAAIASRQKDIPLININMKKGDPWSVEYFMFSLGKLSFYDFSVDIGVGGLLVPRT